MTTPSILSKAAKEGDIRTLNQELLAGRDQELIDPPEAGPLWIATCQQKLAFVEEVICYGGHLEAPGPEGYTPLLQAAQSGYLPLVKVLALSGADLNATNDRKESVILCSLRGDQEELTKFLIDQGADPDQVDEHGRTPLLYSILMGHPDLAVNLIKVTASINRRDHRGISPVEAAIERGNESIVEELLKAGADVDIRDQFGRTPLMSSVAMGLDVVTDSILDQEININAQDENGVNALMLAIARGSPEVVEKLLVNGADIHQKNRQDENAAMIAARGFLLDDEKCVVTGSYENLAEEIALVKGTESNIGDGENEAQRVSGEKSDWLDQTKTAIKGEGDFAGVLETILVRGGDLDQKNKKGQTALFLAASNGHLDLARMLVDCGARTDILSDANISPMRAASDSQSLDIVEMMIDAGVKPLASDLGDSQIAQMYNRSQKTSTSKSPSSHQPIDSSAPPTGKGLSNDSVNVRNAAGQTPLMILAGKGLLFQIKALIEEGADVNAKDFQGITPLMYAAAAGHVEIVQVLLEQGANPNLENAKGLNGIAISVINGRAKCTEAMIQYGAKIHFRIKGVSLLMMAADKGYQEVCRALLDGGADPRATDFKGNRASAYAGRRRFADLKKFLLRHEGSIG